MLTARICYYEFRPVKKTLRATHAHSALQGTRHWLHGKHHQVAIVDTNFSNTRLCLYTTSISDRTRCNLETIGKSMRHLAYNNSRNAYVPQTSHAFPPAHPQRTDRLLSFCRTSPPRSHRSPCAPHRSALCARRRQGLAHSRHCFVTTQRASAFCRCRP